MDTTALDKVQLDRSAAAEAVRVAPELECSYASRILFLFCSPTLRKGFDGVLDQDDIWALDPELGTTGAHANSLREHWLAEVQSSSSPSLLRAILRSYAGNMARQMVLSLVWAALVVVGPAWFLPNILMFLQE